MKKHKLFVFIALLIGAISTALLALYLLRDCLKECPLCSLFGKDDTYDYFDEEFESEDLPLAEEVESAPVKEKVTKVRRGYIPLQFHKENQ